MNDSIGTCKTPDCQNTFSEYAFETQQNPFLYCKDCRDKKKQERVQGGYQAPQGAAPAGPDPHVVQRHEEVMKGLREIYKMVAELKKE